MFMISDYVTEMTVKKSCMANIKHLSICFFCFGRGMGLGNHKIVKKSDKIVCKSSHVTMLSDFLRKKERKVLQSPEVIYFTHLSFKEVKSKNIM